MAVFDASKDWAILVPALPAVRKAAGDMARCLDLLRRLAGLPGKIPALLDAEGPAPDDSVPVILLNAGEAAGEPFHLALYYRVEAALNSEKAESFRRVQKRDIKTLVK
jgi:hypothetical protein